MGLEGSREWDCVQQQPTAVVWGWPASQPGRFPSQYFPRCKGMDLECMGQATGVCFKASPRLQPTGGGTHMPTHTARRASAVLHGQNPAASLPNTHKSMAVKSQLPLLWVSPAWHVGQGPAPGQGCSAMALACPLGVAPVWGSVGQGEPLHPRHCCCSGRMRSRRSSWDSQ